MAQRWRNPYNSYVPWSQCTTCGQDWPSQKITLNPRFGWQCPPCWDGMIQRDQIETPNFPYEGTRKTPSPLTNTLLEGIAPGSLTQTYNYNLRDRATGTVYIVHLVPLTIAANGSLVFTTSATPTLTVGENTLFPVFDGLKWTNDFDLYVSNGILLTESYNPQRMNILQGVCDFGEVSTEPITYLLYDRSHTQNIYRVIFHEESDPEGGVVEVVRDTGPAVGGILLNETWNFYINEDQANFDNLPFFDLIAWDNSHQFYVDTTTYGFPQLIYVP